VGGDLLLHEDVVVRLFVDGEKDDFRRDGGGLAEANPKVASIVFRFHQGFKLDEGKEPEEDRGSGTDGGQDDPPDNGVFFGGPGHGEF
jgi:hypothetical protein